VRRAKPVTILKAATCDDVCLHFTPTVLLESGLGETEAYWGWISPAVASDTRVCVYDRAGRGWSDSVSVPQDGVAVATDLHTLLDRAQVPGPFVLVGHSSGAQYVRIFAGRYPEQAAGMVLLDGQPAEAFEGLPWYPRRAKTCFRAGHHGLQKLDTGPAELAW
jgi:pimeloyl-ACP methyl ester carboxylesterase